MQLPTKAETFHPEQFGSTYWTCFRLHTSRPDLVRVRCRRSRAEVGGGGRAAGEVGDVDTGGAEVFPDAVDELVDGLDGTAGGGADGDQCFGEVGAAVVFDVPAGDEPAHRVAHEHQLGVGAGGVAVTPGPEFAFDDLREACGVVAVREPPSIGNSNHFLDPIGVLELAEAVE